MFVEGVTEANVDAYRAKVDEPREIDIDRLNERLEAETDFAAAAALLVEIDTYRAHRQELGAVGLLMILGKPVDVIPLEDPKLLEAANPVKPGGVVFDRKANDARETEMAKRLLAGRPVSVVVLGGAHDLGKKIAAACSRCEYVVVPYNRMAQDRPE